MQRLTAATAVALAALSGIGCTAFVSYPMHCTWIELDAQPGLEVTGLRITRGEEAACTQLGAPGMYRIRRPDYVIELWNGERYYAEL